MEHQSPREDTTTYRRLPIQEGSARLVACEWAASGFLCRLTPSPHNPQRHNSSGRSGTPQYILAHSQPSQPQGMLLSPKSLCRLACPCYTLDLLIAPCLLALEGLVSWAHVLPTS